MSGAPRHLDERKSGLFIRLRREAIDLLGSWEAAGVWERICYRAGNDGYWTATVQEIADECQLSLHKTKRALEEIRGAGWVTTERAGAATRTLTWTPLWDDDQEENPPRPRGISSQTEGIFPSTLIPETVETLETLLVSEQPSPLALVVAATDPIEAQFAGFWEMYPRKVGKPAALKAFRAALRRATVEDLAAGLRAQLPDLTARDRSLVPHPTTWLNQDRWADDPQQARQAPQTGANHYLAGLSPDFQAQMQQGRAL